MSWRPSRRSLLGGSLAALALGLRARPARAAEARQLIVYWVGGGWDPTITFDPHLDSSVVASDPTATLSTVGGIPLADAASRPSVRSFFERWGARTVVFNGVDVGSISHDTCSRLMLTGSQATSGMDLPTRIALATGEDLPLPHVVINGPRFAGSHAALVSLVSPTFASLAAGELPSPRDAAQEARISAWLEGELASEGSLRSAEFLEGLRRLPALEAFAAELAGVDLTVESGRQAVALRLLAAQASRTVLLGADPAPMAQWDSHQRNLENQTACFENTFADLGTLMEALESTEGSSGASLASTTRILVLSEMGRQPVLNGSEGKDHWPVTSALLIGPDVRGGRVVGGTNDACAPMPLNLATGELSDGGELLRPQNLMATLAAGFDLDPGEWADGATPIGDVWE